MTEQASVDEMVERLRRKAYRREIWHEPDGTMDAPCDADDYGAEAYSVNPDGPEAADLIQQQASEIVRLREALTLSTSVLCSLRKNYEEPFGIWDDVSKAITDGNIALNPLGDKSDD